MAAHKENRIIQPAAPDLIQLVEQEGCAPDCGVVSLAVFASCSYGEALAAYAQPSSVMRSGVYVSEFRAAVARLGVATRIRRRFDLDEDTGVLVLRGKRDHMAYLWAGRIVENRDGWLSPAAYLAANKYRATSLIVRVEK